MVRSILTVRRRRPQKLCGDSLEAGGCAYACKTTSWSESLTYASWSRMKSSPAALTMSGCRSSTRRRYTTLISPPVVAGREARGEGNQLRHVQQNDAAVAELGLGISKDEVEDYLASSRG